MQESILILDFGSQVTQLIGRRLREMNVYCEIHPYNKIPELTPDIKGVILSGSPFSVRDEKAPYVDLSNIKGKMPLLGICYGSQFMAHHFGGEVNGSIAREYGRASLTIVDESCPLFEGVSKVNQVWMSHGDTIAHLPEGARVIASTEDVVNAAYRIDGEETYAVQFHPEVSHSLEGSKMIENFAKRICGCKGDWTPSSFVDNIVEELKQQLGDDKVILGLSGGVDSTVAAVLLNKAIGANLHCIFVDNGLLRKNEFEDVLESYKDLGLNVIGVNAGELFLSKLKDVTDPELKRKAIGATFIEVFEAEAKKIEGANWLAQGTIYPDVIESAGIEGATCKIKSHHNVGGLPEDMQFELVEPLRQLFKDEVRACGLELGLPYEMVYRQPFPGPGLGVRCLGAITRERLEAMRESDAILREEFANAGLDKKVWQYFTVVPDFKSVGVRDNARSYEYPVIIRAVNTVDAMTATIERVDWDILCRITDRILAEVPNVNRVCYDMSPKPNATIEWE